MTGNLARSLEICAARWPDKIVLTDGELEISWASLNRRAGAMADMLADRGVGPDDRVAIALSNKISLAAAVLGTLKVGATATPLNSRLSAGDRKAIIECLTPCEVIREVGDDEADHPARDVAGDSAAIILFTSGSTGLPKGVVLSHHATAVALKHWKGPVMDLGPDDVVLSALPPAHSFGLFGSILAPLLAGASVVCMERFTPDECLGLIAHHQVTVFPGVATMFQRMLDASNLGETEMSSLRYGISGAGPCPWELVQKWRAATGVPLIRGYGMTELFRPVSFSPTAETDVPDAIGRAVGDVELRIVDDHGYELPQGQPGELWIKSAARLTCYLDSPAETGAVLAGPWFKTGDLATISQDGFVCIVGRKKDVIIRGGYTVSAGEIETLLLTHPGIAEAAVIGVADHDLGEEIAAFVTLRPEHRALGPKNIIDFCKERIAGYKYPRKVAVRDELPKGPTGKINKAELRL